MENLIGKTFSQLTVLKFSHFDKKGNGYWLCNCECGNLKVIRATHLKNGGVKSCGCLRKKQKYALKHGVWSLDKRIYKIWSCMKRRCNYVKNQNYKYYGGRGIKVCKEWYNPISFYNWAISNGYRDDLTIDRINVDGDYCPENCRWVGWKEQAKNKRNKK